MSAPVVACDLDGVVWRGDEAIAPAAAGIAALRAAGLCVAFVSNNSNSPVGTLYGPHHAYTVQANGQLTDAAGYRSLIVVYRNGMPVRLNQIGRALDDVQQNKVAGWVRGDRAIVSAIKRQPGTNTVEVMDIQGAKRIHTIPDLAEPQGIYFDPATNRLFVACAKDGTTKIFDGGTFQLLETVKFSGDADNIRFDPRSGRIIVGYGDGALGIQPDGNGPVVQPGRPRCW